MGGNWIQYQFQPLPLLRGRLPELYFKSTPRPLESAVACTIKINSGRPMRYSRRAMPTRYFLPACGGSHSLAEALANLIHSNSYNSVIGPAVRTTFSTIARFTSTIVAAVGNTKHGLTQTTCRGADSFNTAANNGACRVAAVGLNQAHGV
jgi:hypothetical protein